MYVFARDGMGQWSQEAYVKASNPGENDYFGYSVALSADGNTLAAGAQTEDSDATGIDGDRGKRRGNPEWGGLRIRTGRHGAVVTASLTSRHSNTDPGDYFGFSVALSSDGDTLAVGAYTEDSDATGIDGNQASNTTSSAGAVYVFGRDAMEQWSQQAYVKASNTDPGDAFGNSVALSENGDTLVVCAYHEASSATGIDGDQTSNASDNSGAVYVFGRDAMEQWSQQAYVKASNTGANDHFGQSLALSTDGKHPRRERRGRAERCDGRRRGTRPATRCSMPARRTCTSEIRWVSGPTEPTSRPRTPMQDDEFGYRVVLSGDGHDPRRGRPI